MSIKKLLVAINAKYIHSNLAVYSLKAYAENAPYNVENIHITEYTINNHVDDILDDIYSKKPDMIGFSCYIWNIEYVCKIIVELNKLMPHCHIWLGGPEVSYNTDYYLDSYPFIKGILVGEGEDTFANLTSIYDRYELSGQVIDSKLWHEEILAIDGLVSHEKHIAMERQPVDMSKIPFSYKELRPFENRIIYYESSRGCPYSCSYCLSCIEKKLRFRDIELVKSDIDFFLENKVNQVKFIDRTFNCHRQRAVDIWKYILEHDNGITNFHFEISSDLLDDEQIEVLRCMRTGLVQLEIGVQSTNKDTLSAIRRNMDILKLKNMVARLKENRNIHIHLDLIAGLPYEDLASFRKSFNDVYGMKPDELQLGFLKVLHGAYMYDDARKYGIVYKEFPPYEVLYTTWLSYDDVLELKSVEEVLEIYYGSGQFVYSVRYLESFFETPYDFYRELGKFYANIHVCGSKHSRIERYNILLEFAKHYDKSEISEKLLSELMTLDIYLRENSKSRPAFAKDLEEHREHIKEMARSYGISKSEHIEPLSTEAIGFAHDEFETGVNCLTEDLLKSGQAYVRFNYDEINPVTHSAKVYIIKKY